MYWELVRRGYTVYIGKLHTQEIDFIAEQAPAKLYVQVAYKLESEAYRIVPIPHRHAVVLDLQGEHRREIITRSLPANLTTRSAAWTIDMVGTWSTYRQG